MHYEFRVNGMHTDPLTVKLPDAEPIGDSEKEGFQNLAVRMINRIDNLYFCLLYTSPSPRDVP